MEKFLIIDGMSLACRAEFAHNPMYGNDLMTSYGKITGGTFRFFKMFIKLLNQIQPTHIVVVWDIDRNTFRKQIYPQYKKNRGESNTSNSYIMFEDIKNILSAINVLNIEYMGYEGDDLVGTFANLSCADKNFIISGDKDTFQLVNSNTVVLFPIKGFTEFKLVDIECIKNEYNVTPEQFIYLKALMGDKSDNIEGIEGLAVKKAASLINKYENINNIINADKIEVKGIGKKLIENIDKWKEKADLILQLVTICKKVPVEYDYDDCILNIEWNNAIDLFKQLEFNSLIKKIDTFYPIKK